MLSSAENAIATAGTSFGVASEPIGFSEFGCNSDFEPHFTALSRCANTQSSTCSPDNFAGVICTTG